MFEWIFRCKWSSLLWRNDILHFGAIVPFETKEWDKKIGDWIKLPEVK